MASLPHNSTDIYYLDYEVGGVAHTLENRVAGSISDVDASDAFNDLLTALDANLFELNVTGMRKQEAGTNISFPVTYTGTISAGSGEPEDSQVPQFFSFTGRSLDGRRWKVTIFGAKGANMGGDLRQPLSFNAAFQAAVDAIEDHPNQWNTISGLAPFINEYINFGWNSYWQRQRRIV